MAEDFIPFIATGIRFSGPDVAFFLALRGPRQRELARHRDRLTLLFRELKPDSTINVLVADDQSEVQAVCRVDSACNEEQDCDLRLLRCWAMLQDYVEVEASRPQPVAAQKGERPLRSAAAPARYREHQGRPPHEFPLVFDRRH